MIYPNKPLYLLSLLGYIYHLTYYTLTTKDNISFLLINSDCLPAFLSQFYHPGKSPYQAIFLRDFKHCLITIFQSTDINRPAQSAVPAQCCERGSPSSRHFLLQHITRRSLNLCLRYTSACLIKHTSRSRWRI